METRKIPEELAAMLGKVPLKNEHFKKKDIYARRFSEYLEQAAAADTTKTPTPRRIIRLRSVWMAAASAAIIVCLGVTFWISEQHIVCRDGVRLCALPDGTQVTLASASEIRYNSILWYLNREVKMQGTADYDVKHGRVFTVRTSHGWVQVLGTRFEVQNTAESMAVYCESGSVKVLDAGRTAAVVLQAGDSAVVKGREVTRHEAKAPKTAAQPTYREFIDAPIAEVLRAITEMYGLTFVLPADLNGITFTGIVPEGNQEAALLVVSESCDLYFTKNGSNIEIKKK